MAVPFGSLPCKGWAYLFIHSPSASGRTTCVLSGPNQKTHNLIWRYFAMVKALASEVVTEDEVITHAIHFARCRPDYLLLTTHYTLHTTHYTLLTTYASLLHTYYSLLYSLLTIHYTTYYSPLTAHCFRLTTHYSLLTTHYSLLTAHY